MLDTVACNLDAFQYPCCDFPANPRPTPPTRVMLFCQEFDGIFEAGILCSTTKKQVKAGLANRPFHYIVAVDGTIIQIGTPDSQFDTGSTSYDPNTIYVAVAGCSEDCQPFSATGKQGDSLLRVLCCLAERYNLNYLATNILVSAQVLNQVGQEDKYTCFSNFFLAVKDAFRTATVCGKWEQASTAVTLATVNGGAGCGCRSGGCSSCASSSGCSGCSSCSGSSSIIFNSRVTALEASLTDLTNQTAILNSALQTALLSNAALRTYYETIQPTIDNTLANYTAINQRLVGFDFQFIAINDCLVKVCPEVRACDNNIEYQIGAQDLQFVDPNIPRWINFPRKVRDLTKPVVTIGSLWRANLPLSPGTPPIPWSITGTLELAPAEYCAGCLIKIDRVACGIRTTVLTKVMTAGLQPVSLAWTDSYLALTVCDDLHYEITTDATQGNPPHKTITGGTIKFVI